MSTAPGLSEIVLYLTDGRRFSGELVSRDDSHFLVRIAGVDVRFSAGEVERFNVLAPVVERYREMRAAIADDDVDQLITLARWLAGNARPDLALKELDALLSRQPGNPRIRMERDEAARRNELAAKAARPADDADAERPGRTTGGGWENFPLLSPSQVATMKVYEVELTDPAARVDVPRETIERLIERYAESPLIPATREGREALLRATGKEVLELMFRLRAREFYAEAIIRDQPRAMRLFRDDVHGAWIINSCATNACHGGAAAGRLVLANRRPNSDATLYTNLYILERFRTADGRALIDGESPERSALLQLGLPRDIATVKHPPVTRRDGGRDAWRPVFRERDEPRFAQAVAWIRGLYRPRPELNFDYTPVRPFTAPPMPEP